MLNLTPIVKGDQPSSKIKVGKKKVGPGTELVEIRHKGTRAYFYVDPVEDSVVDTIGNKVKMHRNVATLFGGIDRGADFLVDPDVRKRQVEICDSVKVFTNEIAPGELEPFLRGNEYLLHPIEEVVPKGDELVSFEIAEMEPTGYTTLRVPDTTDVEFVDGGEVRPAVGRARRRKSLSVSTRRSRRSISRRTSPASRRSNRPPRCCWRCSIPRSATRSSSATGTASPAGATAC
jgi:transitional endoplasmic reticulum ATPase